MRFETTYFSRENRYSLGIERDTQTHFAEIPVSNQMVDYSEQYKLSPEEYELFMSNPPPPPSNSSSRAAAASRTRACFVSRAPIVAYRVNRTTFAPTGR